MSSPSTKLYGRAFHLVIGAPNDPSLKVDVEFNDSNSHGLDVSGFDCEFVVEKTLKPEPNTCQIAVYNLAESTRKQMSGVAKLTCLLEAGYQGSLSQIFLGETRAAWTERQGPDFITHIECGDSEKELRTSRLNLSVGAKVPVNIALQQIAQKLNVAIGNVNKIAAQLSSKGISTINGGALSGNAAQRMTDFCRSAGLEWSVQDGAIQVMDIGTPLSTTESILVSSDTGMIDSPTVDSQGIVSAKMQIVPGLVPGVLVNFNTLFVNGGYRVQRCKYRGQVSGEDWLIEFEAKKF